MRLSPPLPRLPLVLLATAMASIPACQTPGQPRLADCEKRIEVLQAESSELRKEALTLRTKNRDLAQQAVNDAQQLRSLEDQREQLSQTLSLYQQERKNISQAFEAFKREVQFLAAASARTRTAAAEPPAKPPASLEELAASRWGCQFDAATMAWTIPQSLLFEADSAALSQSGRLLLGDINRLMKSTPHPLQVESIGYPVPGQNHDQDQDPGVTRAGFEPPAQQPQTAQPAGDSLAHARARALSRVLPGKPALAPSQPGAENAPKPAFVLRLIENDSG